MNNIKETSIVNEYSLRTKRQKLRERKQAKEKYIISSYKKIQELHKIERNLGYELLDEPYQKGWCRTYVLKNEYLNHKHAKHFNSILEKINSEMWCRQKAFLAKSNRRKNRKYSYSTIPQPLHWFIAGCSQWLKLPIEEKEFFIGVYKLHKNDKTFTLNYEFYMPWIYELKVFPNIISKRKIIDNVLKQEIDDLDRIVFSKKNRGILHSAKGWKGNRYYEYLEKAKYSYQKQTLREHLNNLNNK